MYFFLIISGFHTPLIFGVLSLMVSPHVSPCSRGAAEPMFISVVYQKILLGKVSFLNTSFFKLLYLILSSIHFSSIYFMGFQTSLINTIGGYSPTTANISEVRKWSTKLRREVKT